MLGPSARTLGRTFPGKGRLGWSGDKRRDIGVIGVGVGEGYLGDDVVPSVKPVRLRSHAGVNVAVAGPSTCNSNAGSIYIILTQSQI